jgi:hypothetical protein
VAATCTGRVIPTDPETMLAIWATDLWFPGQADPIGLDHGGNRRGKPRSAIADPLWYIIWFDAGRTPTHALPELAPWAALHVYAGTNGPRQKGPP